MFGFQTSVKFKTSENWTWFSDLRTIYKVLKPDVISGFQTTPIARTSDNPTLNPVIGRFLYLKRLKAGFNVRIDHNRFGTGSNFVVLMINYRQARAVVVVAAAAAGGRSCQLPTHYTDSLPH